MNKTMPLVAIALASMLLPATARSDYFIQWDFDLGEPTPGTCQVLTQPLSIDTDTWDGLQPWILFVISTPWPPVCDTWRTVTFEQVSGPTPGAFGSATVYNTLVPGCPPWPILYSTCAIVDPNLQSGIYTIRATLGRSTSEEFFVCVNVPGCGLTPVLENGDASPVFRSLCAAPNPTRGETVVRFEMENSAFVQAAVYSVGGRLIRQVFEGELSPGSHSFRWNGRDDLGGRAAAGLYFFRILTPGRTSTARLIVIR